MNWPALREKLDLYEKLMRLDKPIGILLLLWPTLWALWLSSLGRPNWWVVWVFVLGTVLMRSAGCVINDYADREFDKHVERTKERPLTAGKVTTKEALALFAGLSLTAFALVLMLGNQLVIWMSVPAVFLAASYPFTKRFLAIPQAYLGVAFGFGIPMAYAAHLGGVPAEAWWLLLANVFWDHRLGRLHAASRPCLLRRTVRRRQHHGPPFHLDSRPRPHALLQGFSA